MWRYRLVFKQDNNRPILSEEKVWDSNDNPILIRPDEDDEGEMARALRQTQLEQVFANKEFREVADFFRSIKYSHIVPQLVRDPDSTTTIDNDPFGSDFLDRIATMQQKDQRCALASNSKGLESDSPQVL